MTHEIFISYSSKDKPIADGICANLEAAGVRCWIAPRDISPGEDFPSAIAKAITSCKVFVLVFSQNSNLSDDVSNELYLAFNNKTVILPFKIEDVQPIPGKAYYLGRTHWLDAMTPPTLEQIDHLIRTVKSYLNVNFEATTYTPKDADIAYPEVIREIKKPANSWRKFLIALSILIPIILVYAIFINPKTGSKSGADEPKILETSPTFIQPTTSSPTQFASSQDSPKSPTSQPTGAIKQVDDKHATDLFWEDFNDPQNDGMLPPFIMIPEGKCTGMEILQKNGTLSFHTPPDYKPWCGANFLDSGNYYLSEIKTIEYTLGLSPQTRSPHASFGLIFGGRGKSNFDNPNGDFMVICSLGPNNCVIKEGQKDVYKSGSFDTAPGSNYNIRIDVVDPIKMKFRFYVNEQVIGEFSVPADNIEQFKGIQYNLGVSEVHGENIQKETEMYLDNVRIIPR